MKKYVMIMEDKELLNLDVVQRHVEHLKVLDERNKLFLCGPFLERGSMVILDAMSYEEAHEICLSCPFIAEGYKTFKLKTLEVANKDNGYLLNE